MPDDPGVMTRDPQLDSDILEYYERGNEDARLRTSVGRLELWRTQHILRRVLPRPPATILDVGGGSGIHAEWLADAGFAVHLIDPVPLHVAMANQISGVSASIGDARGLDLPATSVDAALLLGPLYHLIVRAERLSALAEAVRVTRPGGLVAAAAISRFASMRDSLHKGWTDDPEWVATVQRAVQTGQHLNSDGHAGRFTTAYFHHPDDLRDEMARVGLHNIQVFAIEGPGSFLHNLDELLDSPAQRRVLMRWIELVELEPTLVGASSHILGVGHVESAGMK